MKIYSSEALGHFAAACYHAGVLDNLMADGMSQSAYSAWVARTESLAISAATGFQVDVSRFVRATSEETPTNLDIGTRSALDALRARRLIATWVTAPTTDLVIELFHAAVKSMARRIDPVSELNLQDEARELATALHDASEARDLCECARIVFSQITDQSFHENGRRMRMLVAPWLGSRVIGMRKATVPLALTINQEVGMVSLDPAAAMARAMEHAVRKALDGWHNVRLLREGLLKECGDRNSSSSVTDAVDYFVSQPMASARDIERALGLSRRGANFVIDGLMRVGVIENAYQKRAKNRVFLCRRALTL